MQGVRIIPVLKGLRSFATTTMRQAEFNVTVPWGEIRGQVWGPAHGRPVLCLHGWADNSGTFNRLIPLLPNEWRFVAIDFPGHGLSSHRSAGCFYPFTLYVADVRRVIEALQWKRFSIIGHSMGGNVAGMFSALYPEMVEALVLLDSYGFFPTKLNSMMNYIKQGINQQVEYEIESNERKEKVYTYDKAKQRLMVANPSLSEESTEILLERAIREVKGGVVFNRDFRINLRNIAMVTPEHCLYMQSLIQARVMLLLASEGMNKQFPPPDGDALQKGWIEQKSTIVEVEGDHHVHLNKPEKAAHVITDFLQSLTPKQQAKL
ncbi:serine hydrolase-like protein [Triplophysa dalaica]|uniref:serine hydrolase-like protein n=1 Tax=Triplophysa dalaica TaxID=1582913 RepID=UPI0024DFAC3D|nr:serine hydrolase-like protein [Triplophysa dalaica]XP_056593479.1 serine hydrolase-like protein [Triplophysa dalaica]